MKLLISNHFGPTEMTISHVQFTTKIPPFLYYEVFFDTPRQTSCRSITHIADAVKETQIDISNGLQLPP